MKHGDKNDAVGMKGPGLNPGSPGTELAPTLLKLVRDVLLKDPEYIERIKRHYRMFRERIDRLTRRKGSRSRKRR